MILNAGVLTVWVDRHDSVSQVRSFLTPSSLVAMKCVGLAVTTVWNQKREIPITTRLVSGPAQASLNGSRC